MKSLKMMFALLAAVAMIGMLSAPAFASTATANLGISATVPSTCLVSTTAVAFNTYAFAAVNATGAVSVTCTNTTPYTVGLDAGKGTGATVTARLMTVASGTATLSYSLYSDSARSVNWGNSTGAWVSGTGIGSAQSLTVYGTLPASQYVTPGSYSDTVGVTVTY